MTLPNLQDYHRPATAEETIALMQQHGDGAMLVAGGTFVHGLEVRGLLEGVTALIDIGRLGLASIRREPGGILLGATTTLADLAAADFVRGEPAFGAVRDALTYPPPQIRNVGTVGGCVAAAAPLYDLPAALLALDGRVQALGAKGARELPLDGFFRGLFESALAPGELITAIAIPAPPARTTSAFLKLETNANDLAILSVAVRLTLDARGAIGTARVVLGGGVGEAYVRAAAAEAALAGRKADAQAFAAAAEAVAGDFEPVADHRGSAAYRRHIAGVYLRRALTTARERLG
ncbi:MAG: FAD binding domain-containing protein [Gammaproteobacteria bacterium]|nr:FAD binding domain-containing protein [Gammaproteobacteria bacterium]